MSIFAKKRKNGYFLDLQGAVNGTIYLAVQKYNDQSKEIYFDQLEYVDTKSKLMRTATGLQKI
jgi:hypothetical protein